MDNQGPKPFWEENRDRFRPTDFDDTLRAAVSRARVAREAKEAAVFVLWLILGIALAAGIVVLTALTLGHAI